MRDNPIYKNRKKDIFLYFLDYGKSFGGAVNTLLRQAFLMKRAGYKIVIFFSDYFGKNLQEKYKEIFLKQSIEYEWATYQITSHPEDVDIICIDKNYEQLKKKIMIYNPIVLHSVQINPCVELISRELNIPHIMNIYQSHPNFFSIQYTDIFPHYHICDSWYWAERWHQYLDTDFTCIRTVVNKADSSKIALMDGMVHYICVGSLCERKNQFSVIKAFHLALQQGIIGKLDIYGYDEGGYADECKRYIQENDLSKWIQIKGFCPEMENVYRQNDALICGSNNESYPNVISEAMAYGLTVISTPVAGVPELVKDGENGYLTNNDSVEAIYQKIVEFNGDIGQNRLKIIRENAYKTYEQHHSPDAVTNHLLVYYEHVVEKYQKNLNIMISDIRGKFAPLIHSYYQYGEQFTDPHKIALKLWYLYHIRSSIMTAVQKKAAFYIWGTGKYGTAVKEMVEVFLPEVEIVGFMDSNRSGTFLEYTIYDPREILNEKNIVVFVTVINGQQEIIRQLKDSCKIYNKDYFVLSARVW
jgi:glycosyltransferase involved in cell wall biosynthesis